MLNFKSGCLAILFTLFTLPAFCKNPPFPYISPGLHLGYTFNQGLSWGGQVTLGVLLKEYLIPGVTFGYQQSPVCKVIFTDFQASTVFLGVGFGSASVTNISSGNQWKGYHFKTWAGFLGLVQYDYFAGNPDNFHTLSMHGVLPIMDYEGVYFWGP